MSQLAKNLIYLAEQEGLRQSAIGKVANVDQATVSRILNGRIADPGVSKVQKLARRFGVTMDDLVSRDLATEGPSVPSQSLKLDPGTMGSALVAVKQALEHESLPFSTIYQTPSALIYAYVYRSLQPATMTRDQYALFDESVRNSLKGELSGQVPEGTPAGRKGRAGAGEKEAQAQPRRRRA